MQPTAKQGLKSYPQLSIRTTDIEKGEPPGRLSSHNKSAPHSLKAGFYLIINVASATSIVFANKTVFSVLGFQFVYTLTLLHVLTTLAGMHLFALLGFYERKKLPFRPLLSLSAAFVGYIVFWNIALQVNTVGFYQLSKICITPAVLVFDAVTSKIYPTRKEIAAVCVLCIGVTLATVADGSVSTNLVGFLIAIAAICTTAVYQVFAGSKQKELEVGSMALMAGYTPIATLLLTILVPIFEPVGFFERNEETLFGFQYTPQAVAAIALTCILGLIVSLSTFLVIGATSSVTYNVVGHVKTVIVLSGGCLLFGEAMPVKRFLGVCLAMSGIVWYSFLKMKAQSHRITSEKDPLLRSRSLVSHSRQASNSRAPSATSLSTVDSSSNLQAIDRDEK